MPATAVRDGLAGYVPEPHRNALVATVAGVAYVDDSKATNPHAASASLAAYPRFVWIAGGQLKGVDIADLVAGVATGWSGRCCSASTGPRSPRRSRDTPRTSRSWRWRGRMMAPWPRW